MEWSIKATRARTLKSKVDWELQLSPSHRIRVSPLVAVEQPFSDFSGPAYIIKITVTYGTLIHTYIARYGNNNIYMLTNKADASVCVEIVH